MRSIKRLTAALLCGFWLCAGAVSCTSDLGVDVVAQTVVEWTGELAAE